MLTVADKLDVSFGFLTLSKLYFGKHAWQTAATSI